MLAGRDDVLRSLVLAMAEVAVVGRARAQDVIHLALAVPVFAPVVLAHHEDAREDAEIRLLPLATLREGAAADSSP